MRIAIVHDYIKEYGGAERVLKVLTEMYPKAPIYTAFMVKDSTAEKEFRGKEIHESWLAPLLKIGKLYSPLRFLTPAIWGSFDLSKYDLVITSCSWYITRGFRVGPKTKVVAYCHTPPRWLYGYETSVGFTKYWPVKVYSAIVGHFMRLYDYRKAQKQVWDKKSQLDSASASNWTPLNARSAIQFGGVDYWIANSKNVQARIKKFYRRDSVVIYPPVEVDEIAKVARVSRVSKVSKGYFLIVSRLVGAKGLEEAVNVFSKLDCGYKLKIVGEAAGYSDIKSKIQMSKSKNIELLGRVDEKKLYELYAKAKGFIALARDEDFGMTVVEAQAAGTPVIAFNGGGFKESVVNGVTGILVDDTDEKTLESAINKFNRIKWDKKKIQDNAKKFSKERFVADFRRFIADSRGYIADLH